MYMCKKNGCWYRHGKSVWGRILEHRGLLGLTHFSNEFKFPLKTFPIKGTD